MRYREIAENKLAFPDAKDFLADIDTSRGRIAEIARRNPWLIQDSQEATRQAFGETFSVFRAITSSGDLRQDGVGSTTTNWNVAYGIMDSAPGVMFHRGDMIENTSYLLHYKITPADVLVWVPHAIKYVQAAIGKRANHSIDGRGGERVKLSEILTFLREQDEEEVVADLTGKTPKILSWGQVCESCPSNGGSSSIS